MKSLVYEGPGRIVPREVEEPTVGATDILVRPAAVAVCFTEVHMYRGLWGDHEIGNPIGHEGVGTIIGVGDEIDDLGVGDRVVYEPTRGCGVCALCLSGMRRACMNGSHAITATFGLFSDRFAAPRHRWRKVGPDLDDDTAAIAEPFAIGTRHVRHSGLAIGDNAIFFGVDDYAGSSLQWARAAGARSRIVVDPVAQRREWALSVGATEAIDPSDGDVAARIARTMPFGADMAFVSIEDYLPEARAYLAIAVEATRLQGTIVLNRVYTGTGFERFPAMRFWQKEQVLRGFGVDWADEAVRGGTDRGDFAVTFEALESGVLTPGAAFTRYAWDDMNTVDDVSAMFDALPRQTVKALVKFSRP